MNITKLATLAGFALALSAGQVLADQYDSSGRNVVFDSAPSHSQRAPMGADLSVFGNQTYGNTFDQGRCVQAINANEAVDVRAFCPPSKWNLVE